VARNLEDRGAIDWALKLLRIGAARGRERSVRGTARVKSEAIVILQFSIARTKLRLLISENC
jgi:hypothetical protein